MINWHQQYRSRLLLAKLSRDNVERVTRVAVPADYTDYVGADRATRRIFDRLEARRLRAIEFALGCSFAEACADRSRRAEVLAVLTAAPEVGSVVGEILA